VAEDDEPYSAARVHWFGAPWPSEALRAPICEDDRYRIEIPVGASCCHCGELIDTDNQGVRYSCTIVLAEVTGQPVAGPIPYAHVECNLRCVTGNMAHLSGNCHHIGECREQSTKTYREEALEVWRSMVPLGGFLI